MLLHLGRFGFLVFYAAALVAAGWFLTAKLEAGAEEHHQQRLAALGEVQEELSDSAVDAGTFVGLMQTAMESELYDRARGTAPSRLRAALRESADGAYNLDVLPGGLTQLDVGNLTGLGGLENRDADFLTEVEAALSLRSVFREVLSQLPNAAWAYYVSANRFEHVYPWQSSAAFTFEDKDFQQEYYARGTPMRNPSRTPYVTGVYEDDSGKGLMITIGRPVYHDNAFKGVVALDFTLNYIDGVLAKFPKKYGDVYLVDFDKHVIGHSARTGPPEKAVLPDLIAGSQLLAPDNIAEVPQTEQRDNEVLVVQGVSTLPFALATSMPATDIYVQIVGGAALEIMIFLGVLGLLGFIEWHRQAATALAKAKEEAEEATKAKSSFLAMMSHEIRTPMNGVMSMAEMLDQTELSEDQRSMSAVIHNSAAALLTIINDILDFSKIEAGKLGIESTPFSVVDVVESAGELVCQRAEDKAITLAVVIDPATPAWVSGDPTRIRQVLINLIGNAVKFTQAGGVTVRVSPARGDNLRFEVLDTGIGLTPEQQGRLFRAFEQADVSTSRKYGGTGLGLSISQRLCELMHGRIGMQSEAGVGSAFWIELPLPIAEAPAVEAPPDVSDAVIVAVGFHGSTRESFDTILTAIGVRRCMHIPYEDDVLARIAAADGLIFFSAQGGDPRALIIGHELSARGRGSLVLAAPRSLASTLSESERAGFLAAVTLPLRRARIHQVIAAGLGRASLTERTSTGNESYDPPPVEEARAAGALILVAEDNATNQVVIRRMLNKRGYAHEMAGDGREALAIYEPGAHGLVLTDFHMPEMDGFELTAAIRRNETGGGRRVPIVALTADALPGTEQRCLDAGMDGYLTKPIDSKLLIAALEKWLPHAASLRRVRQDGPVKPPAAETQIDPLVFSAVQLKETFGGLNNDARTFLAGFIADVPAMATAITSAMDTQDWASARDHAHALKGAALSIGAVRLGELAGEVQDYLDQEDPETALLFAGGLDLTVSELAQAVAPLTAPA